MGHLVSTETPTTHLVQTLQGDVFFAKKDYPKALERCIYLATFWNLQYLHENNLYCIIFEVVARTVPLANFQESSLSCHFLSPVVVARYSSALELGPSSAECHFARGRVLWEASDGDKMSAYSSFLQVMMFVSRHPSSWIM